MSVVAKFVATTTEIHHHKDGNDVVHNSIVLHFRPVFDDGLPEHARFTKATPTGHLTITIDNPEALQYFKPGEAYYLTFETPAEYQKHPAE